MAPETLELRFLVESGKIVISDPCYDKACYGYHEADALDGQWIAEVRYRDEGEWGIRVSSLFAAHIDYDASYDEHEASYIDDLGVDSGQMCVWDVGDYTTEDDRYHAIGYGDGIECDGDGTLGKDMCYRGDFGVACSSGYGDGCYGAECFHLDGEDSPLIALSIRFL